MYTTVIPAGNLSPDPPDIDTPELSEALNAIPAPSGGWRMVKQLVGFKAHASSPVVETTASFVHYSTFQRENQFLRPSSDLSADGEWSIPPKDEMRPPLFQPPFFALIDEPNPSFSDYIEVRGGTTDAEISFMLTNPWATPATDDNHFIRYYYSWRKTAAGDGEIIAQLKQGGTLIAEDTLALAGTDSDWTVREYPLVAIGEADQISDYTNLRLFFIVSIPTETQKLVPIGDAENNGWVNNAGTEELYSAVDESVNDDADYIQSPTIEPVGTNSFCRLDLQDALDDANPGDGTYRLHARMSAAQGGSRFDGIVTLRRNNKFVARFDIPALTTTPTDYTYDLTAAEIERVQEGDNLSIVIGGANVSAGQGNRWVRCQRFRFETPDSSYIRIAQAEVEVPAPFTILSADQEEIFIGTVLPFSGGPAVLAKWDPPLFTDVGRAAAYSDEDTSPWSFCSYGNTCVATNFRDAVQGMNTAAGDTEFDDLITTPSPGPGARFCAAVGTQLLLADINYAGSTTGQPDEIWAGQDGDPTLFETIKGSGAFRQRLINTPGRISALIGGEPGYAFKVGAIYRLEWVGPDVWVYPRLISRCFGTQHPQSVIAASDGQIYFYAAAGYFARIKEDGVTVEPIGIGIARTLSDPSLDPNWAISHDSFVASRMEIKVVGAYDYSTGNVVWILHTMTNEGDIYGTWGKRWMVAYNVYHDRWSQIDLGQDPIGGEDYFARSIMSSPKTGSTTGTFRNLYVVGRSPAPNGKPVLNRFESPFHYPARFTTKIFSARMFPPGRTGENVIITGVRPMFRPAVALHGDTSITVVADDVPEFFDTKSESADATEARGRNGWFPLRIMGKFLRTSMSLPTMAGDDIRDFLGFEYQYSIQGRG